MAMAMSEEARKLANLRLLQRRSDRTISEILGNATHIVLYEFQQASQSWEKSNVEGSLFVVTCAAGYQLIVLNRNSSENYHLAVSKDLQMQHKDPYLMFKQLDVVSGTTAIRGIWFHNAAERTQIFTLLTQLVQKLRTTPTPVPSVTPVSAPASVDPGTATAALMSTLGIVGGSDAASNSALRTQSRTISVTSAPSSAGAPVTTTTATETATYASPSTSTPEPQQRHPPSSSPSSPAVGQAPLLDKKSLQLALLSLIQDDRFLDLLHAQYLKVAHARAGRGPNGARTPPAANGSR